jgi:hypothetical protein
MSDIIIIPLLFCPRYKILIFPLIALSNRKFFRSTGLGKPGAHRLKIGAPMCYKLRGISVVQGEDAKGPTPFKKVNL